MIAFKALSKKQHGFTLVELAIVMIIIGLLLGGVLKGQQLISNAKVKGTISQLKAYQAAFYSFKDSYGAIPGDMRNANTRLQGCDAGNANSCLPGDGNSLIGPIERVWADEVSSLPAHNENVQYWKHLALADLITGIDPSINTTSIANFAWGATHPASVIRGGFQMVYSEPATWNTSFNGHILRLQGAVVGNPVLPNGENPLNSKEIRQIDQTMDDGYAETGVIVGDDGQGGDSPCEGDYGSDNRASGASDADSKDCVMYFKIDG